jgi:TM2 domain-containing membrane protein YozV
MEEKSVPDAIRELEDDFAAGRIGSKEFVRAMKELLARRTPGPSRQDETWTEPPASAAPDAPPPAEPGAATAPEPAPQQPAKPKSAAKAPENPWAQPDLPPIRMAQAAKASEPKPRVIVKGAAPWDKEEEQVRFESVEAQARRKATGGVIHDGEGVLRERLATLADEEVKNLLQAKDPNLAALLSLLLGGCGQFYLGQIWLGVAFLAVWLLSVAGLIMGETWVLYILAPAQVLAAALAQRDANARNLSIDQKQSIGERMRRRGESSFDPDKAVRTTNKLG